MPEETISSPSPNPDPRSQLAAVSVLLEQPEIVELIRRYSRAQALDAIREAQDSLRREIATGASAPSLGQQVARVCETLDRTERDRLRPVVNASGIVLNTNLGRAVLPQAAVDALAHMNRCCNLQVDIETGKRGKRNARTEQLLCRLTGAEAACIVTNNAAATLLILNVFAQGREVIVSRGQLIEIGGAFRLPDCIHQSGATMVEVGTTNKTHLRDYEQAVTDNTAVVLRCNPSNYRVVGFSKSVPIGELVAVKKKKPDLLVVDDLGCGALVDLSLYGLPKEPTVQESVRAGADLVCFSGDKLISGPQAGIIIGRKDLIVRIKKHPLVRMLRVGKLTDLVLEQTLRLFLDPETLTQTNPTLRMLALTPETLKRKAQGLKRRIDKLGTPLKCEIIACESATGGGSLPDTPLDSWAVAIESPDRSLEDLNRALRLNEPPIIARIGEGRVLLDVRTLLDGDEETIVKAIQRMF